MNFKRLLKPILVILAILILTLSVSAGDLFSTYDKRIKLTIDHTKIDADLAWFPVTVFLGNYGDAIDVGAAATNRGITESAGFTIIAKNNPANSSGTITSVEIYAETNMNGVIVATFSADGNNITARDSYSIGSVTAGSKQTFEVELSVETGDYLGFYNSSGGISLDGTGGDGRWYKSGDYTDCVDEAFTSGAGTIYSIYATGFEKVQGEEVFTEFDADEDFDRIAFTTSDGETQLYADCELFDVSENKAIYHVSKTGWTVSSSTDTDIYLYYDNTAGHNTTYISKSGGTAAQSVWDSNFKAVYHMNDPDVTYDTEYDGSALPTASDPSWNYSDGQSQSEDTYCSVSSGILTIDATQYSLGTPKYSLSPDVDFDAGVYIKARIKIDAVMDADLDKLEIFLQDGTQNERTFVQIQDGRIRHRTSGGSYTNYSKTTSNDYHIYEFYVKGTSSKFYMDGVLLGEETVESSSVSDAIIFGNTLSNSNLKAYIDYFNYALDIDYNPGTGIVHDATSNANHGTKKGTNEPIEATGKVGQGQDFASDGTDYITADFTGMSTSAGTVEFLAYVDNLTSREDWLFGHTSPTDAWQNRIMIKVETTETPHTTTIGFGNNPSLLTGLDPYPTDEWFLVHLQWDGSDVSYYVNNVLKGSDSYSGLTALANTAILGNTTKRGGYNRGADCKLDEVRFSSTARSAAWIAATYDSLWDTLLTYGAEETEEEPEAKTNILFIFSNF